MATIYYADDEQEIREIVSAFLRNDGHEVVTFENGDLLLAAFRERPCDLVLLDIMMPGTDGIGVLTALRSTSTVPVILLTAKDTDSDYYTGLSLGSDDYITKPFKPMILSAKVHALLRRVQYESQPRAEQDTADLRCGNLYYDGRKQEFSVGGTFLRLTPTEMKFLAYMMGRFEENVSKADLMDAVWDIDTEIESRAADETNRRLRKKLTAAGADVYAQTVWGYGFKLTKKEGSV
ncbi:MAG: response regulator transcription factor [Eubacteriales bacterium]|nr:response regulator transcription factor [Eubacteriales bacterium]